MTTDADRIAALERKVEVLQGRLDWALLSSQWLLGLINAVATNPTLRSFNVTLDKDEDRYEKQYTTLREHVDKSITDSLAEQEIVSTPHDVE